MCSIRGIVSIGAIAPTIFEDIYIDTYEIFYHFHPNEEDTTKSKKLHPQSWIPINTPVLSIPSNNFFLAGLFLRAFLFLVYYENYSKLHEIVCTVKIFQNLKSFEVLHRRKKKFWILRSFNSGITGILSCFSAKPGLCRKFQILIWLWCKASKTSGSKKACQC